jgi:MFS family permease
VVASLARGFATTSLLLNVARAAQGLLGGAFLLTASLAIIGNTFKGAERTRAFAVPVGNLIRLVREAESRKTSVS